MSTTKCLTCYFFISNRPDIDLSYLGFRNNEINEENSEILARSSLNPKHDMEVTELSRNSLRLPKMSTVSNTFEMAELLR